VLLPKDSASCMIAAGQLLTQHTAASAACALDFRHPLPSSCYLLHIVLVLYEPCCAALCGAVLCPVVLRT
jgi:hypothetical protein